jgi:hypothetical protein
MSRLPAWRFRAPFEDSAGKVTGPRAREQVNDCIAMTRLGSKAEVEKRPAVVRSTPRADIPHQGCHVSLVPIAELGRPPIDGLVDADWFAYLFRSDGDGVPR